MEGNIEMDFVRMYYRYRSHILLYDLSKSLHTLFVDRLNYDKGGQNLFCFFIDSGIYVDINKGITYTPHPLEIVDHIMISIPPHVEEYANCQN